MLGYAIRRGHRANGEQKMRGHNATLDTILQLRPILNKGSLEIAREIRIKEGIDVRG